MARPTTPLTLALRKLWGVKGDIDYTEAREHLAGEGFDVPAKPGEKSPLLTRLMVEKGLNPERKKLDEAKLHKILARWHASESDVADVLAEIAVHQKYKSHENHYNVTKYAYFRDGRKATVAAVSRRPTGSRNVRAQAKATTQQVVRPRPKHTVVPAPSTTGVMEAITLVESMGGLPGAERKLAEMRAEAVRLETAIGAVRTLVARVSKSA